MTIISAPAGSGKTSLLRAWADRPGQRHRLAVMQVQRDQQDAQQFWLVLLNDDKPLDLTTVNSWEDIEFVQAVRASAPKLLAIKVSGCHLVPVISRTRVSPTGESPGSDEDCSPA